MYQYRCLRRGSKDFAFRLADSSLKSLHYKIYWFKNPWLHHTLYVVHWFKYYYTHIEVGVATMLLTNCAHIVQVDAKEKTPIVNYFMIRWLKTSTLIFNIRYLGILLIWIIFNITRYVAHCSLTCIKFINKYISNYSPESILLQTPYLKH